MAFVVIPWVCHFRWWWLTRSISRLLTVAASFSLVFLGLLLLPWLEAAHGVGIGVSVLSLFQVEYRYLDCRGIDFSHQAFLIGDINNSANEPAVYFVIYQIVTIVVIFGFTALLTWLIQYLLVKRSMSSSSRRLGVKA